MELYVHIPFCVKKCNYCDFLSFAGYGCDADETHRSLSRAYTEVLCSDLKKIETKLSEKGKRNEKPVIDTVFIGGGTPSALDADTTEQLLCGIAGILSLNPSEVRPEFTIECNPGTITEPREHPSRRTARPPLSRYLSGRRTSSPASPRPRHL